MPRHVHRVVYQTENDNRLCRSVDEVEKEMARGPAALADVKKASFGREAFAMVTKFGIFLQPFASLGDQSSVLRNLRRPELRPRRTEDLPDVRLRGFGEDQAHGLLRAKSLGLGLGHEGVEFFVGLELGTIESKRLHPLIPCGTKQPSSLRIDGFALLERFLAREKDSTDACETSGSHLCFGEARNFFGDVARVDAHGHSSTISQ